MQDGMQGMSAAKLFRACCLAVCLLSGFAAHAKGGPPVPDNKKLLAFAINSVDSAYLKEHIAELEQIPIDGVIIAVYPDDWQGNRTGMEERWFGNRKFSREDFKRDIADLKAIKFNRFTDNFINFATSVRPVPAADWFDSDEKWAGITENAGVAAYIAKESGFKGLFFDTEHYMPGVPERFDYKNSYSKEHSFDECAVQVRKRGRQIMEAIIASYPDITILFYINISGRSLGPYGTERIIDESSTLLSPFADGVLEALGPKATLVDAGGEGYFLKFYKDFSGLRRSAEKKGLRHTRVPELYKKIQYAFGVWIDPNPNDYGGWHTKPEDLDKNFRSPEGLEHAIYNALTVADKYVWLYVHHPEYWWNPDSRLKENLHRQQQNQCQLCPHSVMPQAYLDALRNCRKPHDLNWWASPTPTVKEITAAEDLAAMAGKGKNLIKNGDFEAWTAGGDKAPDGWGIGGQGPTILREKTSAKDGSYSVRFGSTVEDGHVFMTQSIPAAPYAGKTIRFGAWVRMNNEMAGIVSIMDWVGDDHKYETSNEHPGDDGWRFLSVTRTIRKDATGNITFQFNLYPRKAGAVAYFDGAIAVVEDQGRHEDK